MTEPTDTRCHFVGGVWHGHTVALVDPPHDLRVPLTHPPGTRVSLAGPPHNEIHTYRRVDFSAEWWAYPDIPTLYILTDKEQRP